MTYVQSKILFGFEKKNSVICEKICDTVDDYAVWKDKPQIDKYCMIPIIRHSYSSQTDNSRECNDGCKDLGWVDEMQGCCSMHIKF